VKDSLIPGIAFVGKLFSIAGQAIQLTGGPSRDVSFQRETDGGSPAKPLAAKGRVRSSTSPR
jgi:hypothetical protein